MRRSAWGLDSPRVEPSARCADPDVNPDWWSADSWSERGLAVHLCLRHCPVRAWCERDRDAHPRRIGGTVRAGVFYVGTKDGPKRSAGQPDEVLCGSCEQKRRDTAVREMVKALRAPDPNFVAAGPDAGRRPVQTVLEGQVTANG